MSPEIRINKELLLDVEDQTHGYDTSMGRLFVYLGKLSPNNNVNEVGLAAEFLRGRLGAKTEGGVRFLKLNRKGYGSETLKGGEMLTFQLKNSDLVKKPVKPRKPRTNRVWRSW